VISFARYFNLLHKSSTSSKAGRVLGVAQRGSSLHGVYSPDAGTQVEARFQLCMYRMCAGGALTLFSVEVDGKRVRGGFGGSCECAKKCRSCGHLSPWTSPLDACWRWLLSTRSIAPRRTTSIEPAERLRWLGCACGAIACVLTRKMHRRCWAHRIVIIMQEGCVLRGLPNREFQTGRALLVWVGTRCAGRRVRQSTWAITLGDMAQPPVSLPP
jgi:hypothetical protein